MFQVQFRISLSVLNTNIQADAERNEPGDFWILNIYCRLKDFRNDDLHSNSNIFRTNFLPEILS